MLRLQFHVLFLACLLSSAEVRRSLTSSSAGKYSLTQVSSLHQPSAHMHSLQSIAMASAFSSLKTGAPNKAHGSGCGLSCPRRSFIRTAWAVDRAPGLHQGRPCRMMRNRNLSTIASSKRRSSEQAKATSGVEALKGFFTGLGSRGKKEEERFKLLHSLFFDVTPEAYAKILAKDFIIRKPMDPCAMPGVSVEAGGGRSTTTSMNKQEWMDFLFSTLKPAIPDFQWGSDMDLLKDRRTAGMLDQEGWCLCTVQVAGHHTGSDLRLGKLPPLPSSGRHFCFPMQIFKVRLDLSKGQVTEIEIVPGGATDPLDLYKALGGEVPGSMQNLIIVQPSGAVCVKSERPLGML